MASRESELESWTIAQIADEFGVTHRTVRHYEDLGLLSPERRGLNRVYHRRDRTRLNLILRGKRLGFPLEEIRTIIDLYDARAVGPSQLEYVLGQMDERRADLEQRPTRPRRRPQGARRVRGALPRGPDPAALTPADAHCRPGLARWCQSIRRRRRSPPTPARRRRGAT